MGAILRLILYNLLIMGVLECMIVNSLKGIV